MLETAKFWLDIAVTGFGLLAAASAVFALLIGSKIDAAKKLEEQTVKAQIAASGARAEEAKKEAANALASAAATNERANALELEAGKQKERAAVAEKELLELEERMKPRNLTSEQASQLISILKSTPKGKVNVSSVLGNSEASNYASQILRILTESGWTVSSGIGLSTITGEGLFIITPNQNDANAVNLQNIFASVGITIKKQIDKSFPLDVVTFFVGDKH